MLGGAGSVEGTTGWYLVVLGQLYNLVLLGICLFYWYLVVMG